MCRARDELTFSPKQMKRLVVAAAALNQTPLDWERNIANIREAIRRARAMGAQVLSLPELCLTGYGCEDAFHSSGVISEALDELARLAPLTKGLLVSVGLPVEVQGAVYSAVALLANGKVRGFVCKQHLAGDGIHYEPRWFKPWPRHAVSHIEVAGREIPVGDLVFEVGGIRIGFEICEDAWVGERPGIDLAKHGVDLILNASASPFSFGKHEVRKRFALEASRAFGVSYAYSNLLGCESGRIIYDGGPMVCSHGELVAQGPRLTFISVEVVAAEVDIDRSRLMRRRQASYRPSLKLGERLVAIPSFRFVPRSVVPATAPAAWEGSVDIKHEEFARAVSLGLFDYMRKSHSEGFVVSLSGGVDSAAASCLVVLMIKGALAQMGLSGIKKKLSYIRGIQSVKTEVALTKRLLACVYQASANSSQVTHRAAKAVATELGADFFDISIAELVSSYEKLISKAMGITLSWKEHDLARQNVQARVRSPAVWLLANLRRALLLSTSNRSEAAVGYTTMDGDSSGGLSPLGGIDKAYLRTWLEWLQETGPKGLTNFTSLKLVNAQAPTAELRPLKDKQTDERDLMPYVVLDAIERHAIRDKRTPREVADLLKRDFRGRYATGDLVSWVERFFVLWSRNQWKRERYAPSFHLDDENLDPKTWCRFPILSGGFERELRELRGKRR